MSGKSFLSVYFYFSRLINEVSTLPYSHALEILNLTTLAERRVRGVLIEAFNTISGLAKYQVWFKYV